MRAAALQLVGVVALVAAAAFVSVALALLVLGIALLVFGTLEELR